MCSEEEIKSKYENLMRQYKDMVDSFYQRYSTLPTFNGVLKTDDLQLPDQLRFFKLRDQICILKEFLEINEFDQKCFSRIVELKKDIVVNNEPNFSMFDFRKVVLI